MRRDEGISRLRRGEMLVENTLVGKSFVLGREAVNRRTAQLLIRSQAVIERKESREGSLRFYFWPFTEQKIVPAERQVINSETIN